MRRGCYNVNEARLSKAGFATSRFNLMRDEASLRPAVSLAQTISLLLHCSLRISAPHTLQPHLQSIESGQYRRYQFTLQFESIYAPI